MMGWESFEFPNNPFTTTSCNSYLKGMYKNTIGQHIIKLEIQIQLEFT